MEAVGQPTPGGGWANAFSDWVDAHKYYPRQAALNNEQGPSKVRLVVDHAGRVLSVEMIGRSGSQSLDLALTGLFRGAHLPPIPSDYAFPEFTFDFTMNYIIIH